MVHIRYFILKMSKILHRVRFIVGIFFPLESNTFETLLCGLCPIYFIDIVRCILSTLYGVFYRHCTVYFTDIVRFNLQTLYGVFNVHCTVYLTFYIFRNFVKLQGELKYPLARISVRHKKILLASIFCHISMNCVLLY